MKLSIFPKSIPHPKNKEEKDFYSKFCSSPYKPEIVEVNTSEELIALVKSTTWSPTIFKTYRKNSEFVSIDFMVLDIDNGITIQEATKRCNSLGNNYYLIPTTNHSAENHRFRVIFPLLTTITSISQYKETWLKLQELIPEIDEHCSDVARFYFASKESSDSVYFEGKLLQPVIKKAKIKETEVKSWIVTDKEAYKNDAEILSIFSEHIPESVDYFYKNAHTGLPNNWICRLNSCVFTLSSYGLSDEYIWKKMNELFPEPATDKDIFHIKNAIKDAKRKNK